MDTETELNKMRYEQKFDDAVWQMRAALKEFKEATAKASEEIGKAAELLAKLAKGN